MIRTQIEKDTKEFLFKTKEDFSRFYKIYAGFERDRNGNISGLEIIDGYLKPMEALTFRKESTLENGISCFEVEIVPNSQINTYLKIPICTNLMKSVLVKVFRNGQLTGYQLIDLEGNILR